MISKLWIGCRVRRKGWAGRIGLGRLGSGEGNVRADRAGGFLLCKTQVDVCDKRTLPKHLHSCSHRGKTFAPCHRQFALAPAATP